MLRLQPRVILTVEGTPTDFLVDTEAEFSVLKKPMRKLKNKKSTVIPYSWTTNRMVDLGKGQVTHSLLHHP